MRVSEMKILYGIKRNKKIMYDILENENHMMLSEKKACGDIKRNKTYV